MRNISRLLILTCAMGCEAHSESNPASPAELSSEDVLTTCFSRLLAPEPQSVQSEAGVVDSPTSVLFEAIDLSMDHLGTEWYPVSRFLGTYQQLFDGVERRMAMSWSDPTCVIPAGGRKCDITCSGQEVIRELAWSSDPDGTEASHVFTVSSCNLQIEFREPTSWYGVAVVDYQISSPTKGELVGKTSTWYVVSRPPNSNFEVSEVPVITAEQWTSCNGSAESYPVEQGLALY